MQKSKNRQEKSVFIRAQYLLDSTKRTNKISFLP